MKSELKFNSFFLTLSNMLVLDSPDMVCYPTLLHVLQMGKARPMSGIVRGGSQQPHASAELDSDLSDNSEDDDDDVQAALLEGYLYSI